MQQTTPCINCGQPLPAGAAFCPNCGTRQTPANQSPPTPAAPSSGPQAETMRASAPPAGDYAPTQLQPPPAPLNPPGGLPAQDAYAAQYPVPPPPPPPIGPSPSYPSYGESGAYPSGPGQPPYVPPPPPPPSYAPGPPSVITPGGGVAPWAQPPKKRSGRWMLGCLVAVLVVVLVCGALGAGAYFLVFHKSSTANNGNTGSSTPGASLTPGAGNTPGATNTPGSSGSAQMLNNINRQAVYAGVMITIMSAIEAQKVPDDFQNFDPEHDNILKITAKIDFEGQRHGGFFFDRQVMVSGGNPIEPGLGHGIPKDEFPTILGDPITLTGAFYFEVPKTPKITDWILVIGESNEVPVIIPLAGPYDPTTYQEIPHTMGLNIPIKYDNGNITGAITKIITVTWNPCGCQAPKGMRFLRLYFHVTNNTSAPVFVGDGTYPQYLLLYPNGDRMQADTRYNAAIDAMVDGKESKDVGFDSWVIPADPAPYMIVFLNPDGSKAGQIDLGTV